MKSIIVAGLFAGAAVFIPISAIAGGYGSHGYDSHYKHSYPYAHPHKYKKSYGMKRYGKHHYHGHAHPHAHYKYAPHYKPHRGYYKHGYGHPHGKWKHPMCHKYYSKYGKAYKGSHSNPHQYSDSQLYGGATDSAPEAITSPKVVQNETNDAASKNIIDTAVASGQFNTLVAAIKSAELVSTLEGEGPFTVFAPTDEAFAKIPDSILSAVLNDKQATKELLTMHVVPGAVSSDEAAKLQTATTVQGSNLTIDTTDGIKVNGARVVSADIAASNGVIHVIDSVVLPN